MLELRAFLDEYEIVGEMRRRYRRWLQSLDAAYLKHCYDKMKRESDKSQKKKRK
jgi:hypothetical protein